jgi:hypothetical protein
MPYNGFHPRASGFTEVAQKRDKSTDCIDKVTFPISPTEQGRVPFTFRLASSPLKKYVFDKWRSDKKT